jgi:hypothetical protein
MIKERLIALCSLDTDRNLVNINELSIKHKTNKLLLLSDYFAMSNYFDQVDETSTRSNFEAKLHSIFDEMKTNKDNLPSALRAIKHSIPFIYVKKLESGLARDDNDRIQLDALIKTLSDNYIDFLNDFKINKFKDLIQLNQILLKNLI